MFGSRLLPASGEFPRPGLDITGTRWQSLMKSGEVAVFCLDGKTGQPLRFTGEPADLPIHEYCMAHRWLGEARRTAKGRVLTKPNIVCTLYNKRGRWLGTFSKDGEERRNPGLGLALVILRFPLFALLGTLLILAGSALSARYFGTKPIRWSTLDMRERIPLVYFGLGVGGLCALFYVLLRDAFIVWYAWPAQQPIGSEGRERFYERLARRKNINLLVPAEISLVPSQNAWPAPEKYLEWRNTLAQSGFQEFGQYLIPEVKADLEFWINSRNDLTAAVVHIPTRGMWISAITRYADGASFEVANRESTGLNPHPTKKILCLGASATASEVLAKSLLDRPDQPFHSPTPENVLTDYRNSWREYVVWKRSRPTTAQEYKNIDLRRAARKVQSGV